jgi:hypothetical protein
MSKISEDLAEMKKKLSEYVDKGRTVGYQEVRKEPVIAVKPDKSKIKPLRKVEKCDAYFMAVDCSTRTLKRANNWGVYLMRASYASVEERNVDWGYEERMCTVIGDAYGRSNFLKDFRIELESQMALKLLRGKTLTQHYDHWYGRSNYLLLDGGAYFGGERKFRVSLYEECKKQGINLLAISKNSPLLHDEKGRDFVATTTMLSPYGMWVYHPIRKANKDQTLYGDVSVVKLSEESPRVFRCDIIWLAHDFSAPSNSKLLDYYMQVEEIFADSGLLDVLRMEELSCNFADELHGVRHPFELEWIERV